MAKRVGVPPQHGDLPYAYCPVCVACFYSGPSCAREFGFFSIINVLIVETEITARLGLHVHVLRYRPGYLGLRGAFGTAHADCGRMGTALACLCVHRGRHPHRHFIGLIRCLSQASALCFVHRRSRNVITSSGICRTLLRMIECLRIVDPHYPGGLLILVYMSFA